MPILEIAIHKKRWDLAAYAIVYALVQTILNEESQDVRKAQTCPEKAQ
jgi:hypothetical protein